MTDVMNTKCKRVLRVQAIAASLASQSRIAYDRGDLIAAIELQERSARSYAAARRLVGFNDESDE